MMVAVKKVRATEEEYLMKERPSPVKHEFLRGETYAMAGASAAHNLIASNTLRALGNQLQARPCMVLGSDQRVHVPTTGLYTYPDVTVICGQLRFHEKDPHSLINPLLIVEVLSDTTEDYDRGAKFSHYRTIPSL